KPTLAPAGKPCGAAGCCACPNTRDAAAVAAAAPPVVRMVRRLESIIGYLPCRCCDSCVRRPALKLSRQIPDLSAILIVPQIKPVDGATAAAGVADRAVHQWAVAKWRPGSNPKKLKVSIMRPLPGASRPPRRWSGLVEPDCRAVIQSSDRRGRVMR